MYQLSILYAPLSSHRQPCGISLKLHCVESLRPPWAGVCGRCLLSQWCSFGGVHAGRQEGKMETILSTCSGKDGVCSELQAQSVKGQWGVP